MRAPEKLPLNGEFLIFPSPDLENLDMARPPSRRDSVRLQSELGRDQLPELILDKNNLLPFHFLRDGDRLGRAVVKILRGDGACGTGFLVAPDVVLTNNHVLPDRLTAATSKVIANYEAPALDAPEFLVAEVPLEPETLFVTEPGLDFTFCAVTGLEKLGTIAMNRDSRHIVPTDLVNIIQHPRGRPKEIALHDNEVVKADRVILHYLCDTEPGSSGSPVFDNRWRLVALHHASVADERGRVTPGVDPKLRFLNEGVRLSAIALWLDTEDASAHDESEAVARLRGLFQGLDSEVGFFGALGRSSRGRSAVEVIVVSDHRDGLDLDVGFWDLGESKAGLYDRVADIGWTLADLRLDLWVLANASTAEACAIREHLDTYFRIEYCNLSARSEDGTPLTVLYRRLRNLSVERAVLPGLPEHLLVRSRSASGQVVPIRLVAPAARGASALRSRVEAIIAAGGEAAACDWLLIAGPAAVVEDPWMLNAASASGPAGIFILIPGRPSAVDCVFATPNLTTLEGDGLKLANDRKLPDDASRPGRPAPIAARLTLIDAEDKRGRP